MAIAPIKEDGYDPRAVAKDTCMATGVRTIISAAVLPAKLTRALDPCQSPSRGIDSTVVKPMLRRGSGTVGAVILTAAETSAKTPLSVGER